MPERCTAAFSIAPVGACRSTGSAWRSTWSAGAAAACGRMSGKRCPAAGRADWPSAARGCPASPWPRPSIGPASARGEAGCGRRLAAPAASLQRDLIAGMAWRGTGCVARGGRRRWPARERRSRAAAGVSGSAGAVPRWRAAGWRRGRCGRTRRVGGGPGLGPACAAAGGPPAAWRAGAGPASPGPRSQDSVAPGWSAACLATAGRPARVRAAVRPSCAVARPSPSSDSSVASASGRRQSRAPGAIACSSVARSLALDECATGFMASGVHGDDES